MNDVDLHMDGQLPWSFICTEAHRYFAASLAWRTLVCDLDGARGNPFIPEVEQRLRAIIVTLREYLLGHTSYPDTFPLPHLVTPPIGFTQAPPGVNVYLRAGLDGAAIAMNDNLYIIAALAGYLLVCVVTGDANALTTWTLETELCPGNPVRVDPRRFPEDADFRRIIAMRAAVGAANHENLSARQRADVARRVKEAITADRHLTPHVIAILVDAYNRREG